MSSLFEKHKQLWIFLTNRVQKVALFEIEKIMDEKNERICEFVLCVDNELVIYFSLSKEAEKSCNSYVFMLQKGCF